MPDPSCARHPRCVIRRDQRCWPPTRRHNPHSGIDFDHGCHTRRGFLPGALTNAYPHTEDRVRSSARAGRHRTNLNQSRRWSNRAVATTMVQGAVASLSACLIGAATTTGDLVVGPSRGDLEQSAPRPRKSAKESQARDPAESPPRWTRRRRSGRHRADWCRCRHIRCPARQG